MKIFLDTNDLFYGIKYNKNKKIKSNEFENLIKTSACYISDYSLFELLNNENYNYDGFKTVFLDIMHYFEPKGFHTDSYINEYNDLEKRIKTLTLTNEESLNQHIRLKNALIKRYKKDITFEILLMFSNYLDVTMYLFKINSHSKYKDIAEYILNLCNSLRTKIASFFVEHLKSKELKKGFTEKNIKKVVRNFILNLIVDYSETYNYVVKILNDGEYPNYDKIKNLHENWFRNIKLSNYLNKPKYEPDLLNIFKIAQKEIREHKDKTGEVLKPNTDYFDYTMSNYKLHKNQFDFELEFIRRNMKSIFEGNMSFNTNSYIDKYIVELFMHSNCDIFITFDEKLISIISKSKEPKLQKSVKVIKGLYK